MGEKICISDLTLDALTAYIVGLGQPKFRAKQIFKWLHQKLVTEFSQMTDQPKALLAQLEEQCTIAAPVIRRRQQSKDGTVKYLLQLADGNCIETVVMQYHHGNTVCISSQVGCRMGCAFCASGLNKKERNLTASEMLGEVLVMNSLLQERGERVTHIVVMGTGEPLDNYENLIRFLRLLIDENGYNLSARNITVSSCGIVPRIYDLAKEDIPITFALSLHAPTDEERKELMPVAHQYTLAETLDACREYFRQTGRRVTFEYSLVKGKNDTEEQARKLAKLLAGMNCHVNLIPVNPIKERNYVQSGQVQIEKFKKLLEKSGINVTIRREMGRDIDGACGQLRKSYLEQHT